MRDAVQGIFIQELGLKPEDISDELTYNSIPEWDSASHMSLILAIEEKFGVALESNEVVRMTSIPKILAILESKGVSVG
jgi:acyl carrier protein